MSCGTYCRPATPPPGWPRAPVVVIIDPGLRDCFCNAEVWLLAESKIPFVVHSGDDHSLVEEEPAFARGYWLSKPSISADIVKAIGVAMTGVRA